MGILEEIREILDLQEVLANRRKLLIERFILRGGDWKDIAFADKFSAIRLYAEKYSCGLETAKRDIEKFLIDNA